MRGMLVLHVDVIITTIIKQWQAQAKLLPKEMLQKQLQEKTFCLCIPWLFWKEHPA
jgi:hypothetical protein